MRAGNSELKSARSRRFVESLSRERLIRCPVLIVHGEPDLTIPTEHGRLLFNAANEPKKLLIFPGAGHNVFGSLGDGYLDRVVDFLRLKLS
jgi:fermentation-respiration switch protein FrsA (DUF1100 family)